MLIGFGEEYNIWLTHVNLIEINIEGSFVELANAALFQIRTQQKINVPGDILMKSVWGGGHDEISFDELITRPTFGQSAIILHRQRLDLHGLHDETLG